MYSIFCGLNDHELVIKMKSPWSNQLENVLIIKMRIETIINCLHIPFILYLSKHRDDPCNMILLRLESSNRYMYDISNSSASMISGSTHLFI